MAPLQDTTMEGSSSRISSTVLPRTYGKHKTIRSLKQKRQADDLSENSVSTALGITRSSKRQRIGNFTHSLPSELQIEELESEIYLPNNPVTANGSSSVSSTSQVEQARQTKADQIKPYTDAHSRDSTKGSDTIAQHSEQARNKSILHYFRAIATLPITKEDTSTCSSSPVNSDHCSSTPPSSPSTEEVTSTQQLKKFLKRPKRRLLIRSELRSIMASDCRKGDSSSREGSGIFTIDESTTNSKKYDLGVTDTIVPAISKARLDTYTQTTLVSDRNVFVECKVCGVGYNITTPEDVKHHKAVHSRKFAVRGVRPSDHIDSHTWTELVDNKQEKHRIFGISKTSGSYWKELAQKAVIESYEFLDGPPMDELRLFDSDFVDPDTGLRMHRYKVYVYLIDNVLACLAVAENIRQAGAFHNGEIRYDGNGSRYGMKKGPTQKWVSLDNIFDVKVCIDRIAVRTDYQNRGLARRTVNYVLETFAGTKIHKEALAWSQPTDMGTRFATNYCKGRLWSIPDGRGGKHYPPFLVNPADAKFVVKNGRLVEQVNVEPERLGR